MPFTKVHGYEHSVFHAKQQGSPQYQVLIVTGAAVMTLKKVFSKLSLLFCSNRVLTLNLGIEPL